MTGRDDAGVRQMLLGEDRGEPFATLEADCPWSFEDGLPGPKRGAASHYGCLTLPDLLAFPLPPLADDATLYLWRVSAMVEEAYQVCRAWGFVPKSEIVWKKTTKHGKRHIGMGRYVRMEHEACIIATRGRPPVLDHGVRSVIEAPVGRHSEKPAAFYRMVERLSPPPRASLFARRLRPGWTCFGNDPALGGEMPAAPVVVETPAQASLFDLLGGE